MRETGPLRVLGTMSGTSLDGVDAAILETDGREIFAFGPTAFRAFSEDERDGLRAALGLWPDAPEAAAAARIVDAAHADVIGALLGDTEAGPVDLIGFHGQTLAHDPGGRGTHQAGDGAKLAEALQIPVVWDFRSADVELGGQGAPFAPAYHHALARYVGLSEPAAFLNLGGVGNLTWLDPARAAPEETGALLAFDTGPANAPLNDHVRDWLGRPFDEDGALAREGAVDKAVLERFAAHSYFHKVPPKSLDRNDFPELVAAAEAMSASDGAATLTAAVAISVLCGTEHFPAPVERLFVTGGGRKNAVMMDMIEEALGIAVLPVEELGLDGDMLEAQAFGYLAARVARGLPTSFPSTTGVAAAVGGGEISRPL
ncbi:MAG: anhydro-N-acetylmuramic acid kinase [Pseudomonadota bacterium]